MSARKQAQEALTSTLERVRALEIANAKLKKDLTDAVNLGADWKRKCEEAQQFTPTTDETVRLQTALATKLAEFQDLAKAEKGAIMKDLEEARKTNAQFLQLNTYLMDTITSMSKQLTIGPTNGLLSLGSNYGTRAVPEESLLS